MKKTILFKSLVDVLYTLQVIGFIAVLIMIPFGLVNITNENASAEKWDLFYWLVFTFTLVKSLVFLRGLYFLRRIARILLSDKYFSEDIIRYLRKSGNHFLLSSLISFALILAQWIGKIVDGKIELGYDQELLVPLFLAIIGIFFIIQSGTLDLAKSLKEENELTV
ncbi:MAG: hypothetical protein DA405_11745 [Bacteroidetes bacterium]|nr:MAG: hypothetical protein DA405_11745 [Bacteroidota bacterium]